MLTCFNKGKCNKKGHSCKSFHNMLLSNMYKPNKIGNDFLPIKLGLPYLLMSNVCGKRLFNVLDLTFLKFWHLATNNQIPHIIAILNKHSDYDIYPIMIFNQTLKAVL